MMSKAQAVIKGIVDAILETVAEGEKSPLGGVPEGHLYAALMNIMGLDTFNMVMSTMVDTGVIRVTDHLVTLTNAGRTASSRYPSIGSPPDTRMITCSL